MNKSFPLPEWLRFNFRGNFFNTFNHHSYLHNVGGVTTPGSGSDSSIDNGSPTRTSG